MKFIILILNILLVNTVSAQNLIQNGSFEDSISLKNWYSHFRYCKVIHPVALCSNFADKLSSEYIPFSAQEGKNCIAISLYFIEIKGSDYVINDILPLEKGKKYSLTFFISSDDSSGLYAKNIDVLFCNSKYLKQNVSCLMPQKIYVQPTLSFDISYFNKDGFEGSWTKLTSDFIAQGNENIMVIGNFSNPKTKKIYGKKKISYKTTKKFRRNYFGEAGYFLDNFSLIEK